MKNRKSWLPADWRPPSKSTRRSTRFWRQSTKTRICDCLIYHVSTALKTPKNSKNASIDTYPRSKTPQCKSTAWRLAITVLETASVPILAKVEPCTEFAKSAFELGNYLYAQLHKPYEYSRWEYEEW